MKKFWLFRSDIRDLEYYHEYKTLKTFENNCHDFYLMMGIEFLKMGEFDDFTFTMWKSELQKELSSFWESMQLY